MLLVIDDGCRKRRGTRNPNMSQGDEECFLLIQRDDVTHDSTFIAGIRQVRNGAMCLIYVGDIFGLKMFMRMIHDRCYSYQRIPYRAISTDIWTYEGGSPNFTDSTDQPAETGAA